MEYDIVMLQEKKVVACKERTNNKAADMQRKIGGLWQKLYGEGVYQKIADKVNEKAVGIYTNYVSDAMGDYDVLVGCEVSKIERLPEGTIAYSIPAGKYAKFVVKGHMQRAVQEFWQKLWKMDLDRSYVCDFEEYQNADENNAIIYIYISLK